MFKKLAGLLKGKQPMNRIDSETAAAFVVRASLDDLNEKWNNMKADIINYDQVFPEINESWVQYEIVLAAIGADTLALYNLFSKEQADQIFNALLKFLGDMEEVGEISVEAVGQYHSVAVEATNQVENPFEFVVSILCDRLEVPEIESGPVTMIGLMSAVGKLVGKWKWIKESFEVV